MLAEGASRILLDSREAPGGEGAWGAEPRRQGRSLLGYRYGLLGKEWPPGCARPRPESQGQMSSSLQTHLTWHCLCSPEAERARTRQARSTAPMEGAVQLLSREGHTVSHNSKRHYHDAFVAMSRMRQRGLLCDIVLHVAAKEIRAHKVVLASCSPYFHAMFTSKYCPTQPGH